VADLPVASFCSRCAHNLHERAAQMTSERPVRKLDDSSEDEGDVVAVLAGEGVKVEEVVLAVMADSAVTVTVALAVEETADWGGWCSQHQPSHLCIRIRIHRSIQVATVAERAERVEAADSSS